MSPSPPVPPVPPTKSALPSAGGVRDATAVTADLAVLQENEGLRLALREQERIVEELTNECRRLEDRLEDRYQDIDALRRDVDRKERLLKEAEQRGFASGQETTAPATSAVPAVPSVGLPAFDDSGSQHGGRLRFVGGLATGVVIASVAGAGLWWSGVLPPAPPFASPVTHFAPPSDADIAAANPLLTPVAPAADPDAAPAADHPAPALDIPLLPPAQAVVGKRRDSAGMEFVRIRTAQFAMGNPVGMTDSDARPVHAVTLDGYWIGAREVTFNDYEHFVRATGARRPSDFGWGRGDRPVVDVSWDEAQAYVRWLSQHTGRHYRLPSEAEWEYAARAGSASSYWWGTGAAANRALCFDCGTRWDRISTAPVGSFAPNPFGLYDTAGNVYEWVADCYFPNYHGAPATGEPRDTSECQFRVARGGSFNSPASAMRSHARQHFAVNTHIDMIGFRLARNVDAADGR